MTETDDAVKIDSDGDIVWLPKSQITMIPDGMGMANIMMPEWLYRDKFPDDPID